MATNSSAPSLFRLWIDFHKTRNFWLAPNWITAFVLAALVVHPRSWVAFGIGIAMYVLNERKAHRDMHKLKISPFHASHRHHHDEPTPETGAPNYWVFVLYALVNVYLVAAYLREYRYPAIEWFARQLPPFWLGLLTMLCLYEWTHYLCHCQYTPRTRWGRMIRINHLTHHGMVEDHADDKLGGSHYDMIFPWKHLPKLLQTRNREA